MGEIKLSELKPGEWAKLNRISACSAAYRRKLISMGLTPGVMFQLIRKAPLGDPVQISVRGSSLLLRKYEADILCLEKQACYS